MTLAYVGPTTTATRGAYLSADATGRFTPDDIAAVMMGSSAPTSTLQIIGAGAVGWLEPVASQVVRLMSALDRESGPQEVSDFAWQRVGQFLQLFMQATTLAPILVPTAGGGLQLEWHSRGWDVEVEIPPKGAVALVIEGADGTDWEGPLQEGISVFGKALQALS